MNKWVVSVISMRCKCNAIYNTFSLLASRDTIFAQIIKRLNSDYCTESVFFSSLEISPILYWMVAELLAGYLIVTPT